MRGLCQLVTEKSRLELLSCVISSTSPPGGNLVDGLPPASSNLASWEKTNREEETNKLGAWGQKSEVYEKSEHSIGLRSSKSQ